jgi:hypothetical protein
MSLTKGQVCVDYFETHDFLLEKIPHIAEQICRCELIEKHLIRSSSPTVDELKRALVKLYAAILTFLAQIKAFFQQATKGTSNSTLSKKANLLN